MNDLHKGKGSTISGAIVVGLLAMLAYGLAKADDYPPPQPCAHLCHHHGAGTDSASLAAVQYTQFVVSQNLSVETVTCGFYFSHTDLTQYGAIEGKSCTSTGPLVIQSSSTAGHIHVTFSFSDGTLPFDIVGCRVDSTVLQPGFNSVAVNCT